MRNDAPPDPEANSQAASTGLQNDPGPQLEAASKHLGLDKPMAGPRAFSVQDLTLPKPGGAIRAIAEKFQANPVTGTGSITIPLTATPARGLEPQLALAYDSGAGQSAFGLGWNVGMSAIRRKTDRGLPQYLDHEDSDVFVMSDAEDLVPKLDQDGENWVLDEGTRFLDAIGREASTGDAYTVRRYRPRVEGGYAQIERWTRGDDVHWRVRDRSDTLRIYGYADNARLSDPASPSRIFAWYLQEVVDDRGNRMVLTYLHDDNSRGVSAEPYDLARAEGSQPFSQIYLHHVRYGNSSPHDPLEPTKDDWLFELRFDYGELGDRQAADVTVGQSADLAVPHHPDSSLSPSSEGTLHPPERPDPHSGHRAGFEIRTRWLCRRVVLYHYVDDDDDLPTALVARDAAGKPLPVAAWLLSHDSSARLATLTDVRRVGFRLQGTGDMHAHVSPAASFGYVAQAFGDTTEALEALDADLLPHGVDGSLFRFFDLEGDGIPGLLTEQGGQWYYQRNLGDREGWTDPTQPRPRLGPISRVSPLPNLANLQGGAQLSHVDGSGRTAVLLRHPGVHGFTQREQDGSWTPFQRFGRVPQVDWTDPTLRFVDLTGDGRPDLLLTEHKVLRWWPSEGADGWGSEHRVRMAIDPGGDPRVLFTQDAEAVLLADMTGDGLQDLVRVRRTSVSYWPNKGYGRFGTAIILADAPVLAPRASFDPARVRLADIDGTGPADLLYFDADGVRIALNQAGNTLADLVQVTAFPGVSSDTHFQLVDLLGDGTSCLVWSSGLPPHRHRPLRYVRLAALGKPYLLQHVANGQGGETHLEYAPSTQFAIADRDAGTPWATPLHFPVQVLTRISHTDPIREHRQVLRFA